MCFFKALSSLRSARRSAVSAIGIPTSLRLAPPQYPLPEYLTVDVRMALTAGRIATQLFVRNVLDEHSELSTFNWNSAYAQAAMLQPRTVGITAMMQF